MKNVSVFGAGKWGLNFLRIFKKLNVLNSFYDTKNIFLPAFNFRSEKDIFKDDKIDCVVISTPISTHFFIAFSSILNNKNVLVEKPLSLTLKEAKILKKLSNKYNKILMSAHLLVYHPAFIKLRRIINSGYLGNIYKIYSVRTGPEAGSFSVLWDYAPHDISMICSLLKIDLFKIDILSFKYLNNLLSQILFRISCKNIIIKIFLSFNYKNKKRKLRIFCKKGSIIFNDSNSINKKLSVLKNKSLMFIKFSKKEPLLNEIQYFLNIVKKKKEIPDKFNNYTKVIKIIEKVNNLIKIYK